MTPPANPFYISAAAALVAQAVMCIRWVIRSIRQKEKSVQAQRISQKFIVDIATNHLPHLYHSDRLAVQGLNRLLQNGGLQQIEMSEPPPIQFIELNGHDKK